jgi:beta-mannosidase
MNKLNLKIRRCFCVFMMFYLCISLTEAQSKIETYNTSALEWTLAGYMPNSIGSNLFPAVPFGPMKAKVPGSVQNALLENKFIKDWNYGMNSLNCEWIENRQWAFKSTLPDEWFKGDNIFRLRLNGLDDNGKIYVNGNLIGTFDNAFVPYLFEINKSLKQKGNVLTIVFDMPVRNLGQIAYTSKIKDFKPRFYYSWDWIKRVVQIGIHEDIVIESVPKVEFSEIENLKVLPTALKTKDEGALYLQATYKNAFFSKNKVLVQLKDANGKVFIDKKYPSIDLKRGIEFKNLKVERWYPNGWGKQPIYTLKCIMLDKDGNEIQTVGKKHRIQTFRMVAM